MRTVVDQVSLKVGHGEIVGLLGPNGAGKTTSFYMVAGLVRPDEGRVIFADEDITELPMNLRARRGMGFCRRKNLFSASFPWRIIFWPFFRPAKT